VNLASSKLWPNYSFICFVPGESYIDYKQKITNYHISDRAIGWLRQEMIQAHTESARSRSGEIDLDPTPSEIKKRSEVIRSMIEELIEFGIPFKFE
jgi:hypothetical protein